MTSTDEIEAHISTQCVDSPDGCPGVVVYGDETFPVFSRQDATEQIASSNGQGLYSSVQPFTHYENEDTANAQGSSRD